MHLLLHLAFAVALTPLTFIQFFTTAALAVCVFLKDFFPAALNPVPLYIDTVFSETTDFMVHCWVMALRNATGQVGGIAAEQ